MDRLEAMSVIVAVAETGSFSAASRRLGTPVATISRRISTPYSPTKGSEFDHIWYWPGRIARKIRKSEGRRCFGALDERIDSG